MRFILTEETAKFDFFFLCEDKSTVGSMLPKPLHLLFRYISNGPVAKGVSPQKQSHQNANKPIDKLVLS